MNTRENGVSGEWEGEINLAEYGGRAVEIDGNYYTDEGLELVAKKIEERWELVVADEEKDAGTVLSRMDDLKMPSEY